MAIKMSDFVRTDSLSVLVNFPTKIHGVKNSACSGYVLDKKMKENISVLDFLKRETNQDEKKVEQALQLVKLKGSLNYVYLSKLTNTELKKVQLAIVLLLSSKVIICEHFFKDLIYDEREYFKRFFRNLLYKKKIAVILIENDMNFICETVKSFFLFYKNEKYRLIDDFYDDDIYNYVEMPNTVSLIKYFESKGHSIDHEITFNETLKAIYRGKQ